MAYIWIDNGLLMSYQKERLGLMRLLEGRTAFCVLDSNRREAGRYCGLDGDCGP
jgi:hypothetical protein